MITDSLSISPMEEKSLYELESRPEISNSQHVALVPGLA